MGATSPPPTPSTPPPAKTQAKSALSSSKLSKGSGSRAKTAQEEDEDDLESAVFQERYGLDAGERDLQTTCIDALLCCLRSRCLRLTCVLFPCVLFLFLALVVSYTSHPKTKIALFILSGVPPLVFVCSGLLLLGLVCCRQVSLDTENAQAAHRYLQARQNLQKIAVTAGKGASGSHITVAGRLALFFKAAKECDVANFQWCLDNDQDVDETDYLGRTALHWAALSGTDEIVAVLLRNGASLDIQDGLEALTPLHYAAYYGHVKIVRLLVAAGADMLRQDKRKMNPLQLCEMASLKMASVQPSHQMILKFLRIAMKDTATPPLQHTTGLTVTNLVERQMMALPQATDS